MVDSILLPLSPDELLSDHNDTTLQREGGTQTDSMLGVTISGVEGGSTTRLNVQTCLSNNTMCSSLYSSGGYDNFERVILGVSQ